MGANTVTLSSEIYSSERRSSHNFPIDSTECHVASSHELSLCFPIHELQRMLEMSEIIQFLCKDIFKNWIDNKSYLVCKNGDHKFSGLECFDHSCYQIIVAGCRNIALETYVWIFILRCNVNCHVTALEKKEGNKM